MLGDGIMVTRTARRKVQLSVTVSPELKAVAEEVAKESNTTPSGVVSQRLEALAQKRTMELMEEGYKVMAKEHEDFAKMTFELQRQVVLREE